MRLERDLSLPEYQAFRGGGGVQSRERGKGKKSLPFLFSSFPIPDLSTPLPLGSPDTQVRFFAAMSQRLPTRPKLHKNLAMISGKFQELAENIALKLH